MNNQVNLEILQEAFMSEYSQKFVDIEQEEVLLIISKELALQSLEFLSWVKNSFYLPVENVERFVKLVIAHINIDKGGNGLIGSGLVKKVVTAYIFKFSTILYSTPLMLKNSL